MTEKYVFVEFTCANGWENVITSIPESEIINAKEYLETQVSSYNPIIYFMDVKNVQILNNL